MIKHLEWDSLFFNKKIGELQLNQEMIMDSNDLVNDFDLIYAKSNADIVIDFKGFTKSFQEVKLIYSKDLENIKYIEQFSCSILPFNSSDAKENLYQLAFESGKYSRFKLDTNFSEFSFKLLYRTWIDKSVTKQFADEVLIYKENKKILGFVSYKINDDHASIGLIAISPNVQGKGIGSKLLYEVERRLFEINIFKLNIPTQLRNEVACTFYSKMNYKVHEQTYISHYWKI